jgi:hypothetical protein
MNARIDAEQDANNANLHAGAADSSMTMNTPAMPGTAAGDSSARLMPESS